MVEKAKETGFITEQDAATLLQRYKLAVVLALLQEVAHWPAEVEKIDWNELVAKTSTGISNAREYQMLWRHLAYGQALFYKFDNETQPLDDDSDLEYEIEVPPVVSDDASTEAAAYVKVLIASGLPSDPSHLDGTTVEAPLVINILNDQSSETFEGLQPTTSAVGINITVPVFVQKLDIPTTTTSVATKPEGVDANKLSSSTIAPQKKRKRWSEEEDLELISAVKKYGEGNWSTILKGDFMGDRTATQLSQRWAIVKKRGENIGKAKGSNSRKPSGKTEDLIAAHQAMNHFLDDGPSKKSSTVGTAIKIANSKSAGTNASKPAVTNRTSAEGFNATKPQKMESLGVATKSRVISKKTLPRSNTTLDSLVRAAAVAAGTRIGTPSDAALIKAAQAKNAIHIRPPTSGSSIKLLSPGGYSIRPEPHPNVHHIRTGTRPSAPLSAVVSPKCPGSSKALSQKSDQQASTINQSKKINEANSIPGAELLPKQEVKKSLVSMSGCARTKQVQDAAVLSGVGQDNQVKDDPVLSPKQKLVSESLSTKAQNPVVSLNTDADGSNDKCVVGVQALHSGKCEGILCTQVSVGGAANQSTTLEQATGSDHVLMQRGSQDVGIAGC